MAGLPKKYMGMKGKTLKQKWAAYRKVHPKGGKKRKASSKPRKKGGSTKRKSYTKKVKSVSKKKFTQGDIFMTDAMLGPAGRAAFILGSSDRVEQIPTALALQYTGYNMDDGSFRPAELIRGWGGMVHEVAIRKFSRATGVQAYPSKKSILELAAFYGKDIVNMLENQDDMQAFYEQHYKDYHGINLAHKGLDAWEPGEMADTRLPLWLIKQLKRGLREHGVNLPKWM